MPVSSDRRTSYSQTTHVTDSYTCCPLLPTRYWPLHMLPTLTHTLLLHMLPTLTHTLLTVTHIAHTYPHVTDRYTCCLPLPTRYWQLHILPTLTHTLLTVTHVAHSYPHVTDRYTCCPPLPTRYWPLHILPTLTLHSESSLQDECSCHLQSLLAAVKFGV